MIDVRNLTKSFGAVTAIDDVTLRIEADSFVVVTGANASGKTTLVRHFNGLLVPDSGSVRVDGYDVQEDPVQARTRVGMVFQHPDDQFVAATVGADVAFGPENLGLPRETIDRRVEDALAAVNLSDRIDARIDTVSGGERARVAIAGALAMEPTYLVLDEPFAGLDHPARQSLLDHLDALSESGTTIVVVTHDIRDLGRRADRMIGLADGRLALDCDPDAARDRLADIDVRVPEA